MNALGFFDYNSIGERSLIRRDINRQIMFGFWWSRESRLLIRCLIRLLDVMPSDWRVERQCWSRTTVGCTSPCQITPKLLQSKGCWSPRV